MKTKTKSILLFLFAAILALVSCAFLFVKTTKAKADENTEDFFIEGMSIRTVEPVGLRFQTEITNETKTSYPDNAVFGTLIIPEHMLEGTLTVNTASVLNVVVTNWEKENVDGVWVYNVALVGNELSNFPEKFYNTDFVARSYVKYTPDGGTETVEYSDNTVTRTMSYVAERAILDGYDSDLVKNIYTTASVNKTEFHDDYTTEGTTALTSDYTIVYPNGQNSGDILTATTELKNLILEATGLTLEVKSDTEVTRTNKIISVGATAQAVATRVDFLVTDSLGDQGFVVKTVGDSVYMLGGSDKGTLYAAYEFLNKQFDFETFAKDSYSLTKTTDTVTLKNIYVTEKPDFEWRAAGFADYCETKAMASNSQAVDRMHLMSYQGQFNNANGNYYVHNVFRLISPDAYQTAHPNWFYFGDLTGDDIYKFGQLCLEAKGDATERAALVNQVATNMIACLKADTSVNNIAFSQNDGDYWCDCSSCSATTPMAQLIVFANEVEKIVNASSELAGRTIKIFIYSYSESNEFPVEKVGDVYQVIDEKYKLSDNVGVMFCASGLFGMGVGEIKDADKTAVQDRFDQMKACLGENSPVYGWTYSSQFGSYLAPNNGSGILQATYSLLLENGVTGIFDNGEYDVKNSTNFTNFKQYLSAELLWNANADVNALKTNFFNTYYGPASQSMQNLYAAHTEYTKTISYSASGYQQYVNAIDGLSFSKDQYNTLMGYINQAYADIASLETSNSTLYNTYKNRIEVESLVWRFMDLSRNLNGYSNSWLISSNRELYNKRVEFANACIRLGVGYVEGRVLSTDTATAVDELFGYSKVKAYSVDVTTVEKDGGAYNVYTAGAHTLNTTPVTVTLDNKLGSDWAAYINSTNITSQITVNGTTVSIPASVFETCGVTEGACAIRFEDQANNRVTYVNLTLIATLDGNDQSTWYETSATKEKVDGTHTKFTASDNQIGITVKAEAITYLSEQGYDKVEFTVKTNSNSIQIYRDCLRHSADVVNVTNSNNNCVVFSIDITEEYKTNGLQMLIVNGSQIATVSLAGTSFDENDQSTWYSVSTSKESVESGAAVKFTPVPQGNESIIFGATLMAEAIQFLESQGYSKIQLTVTSLTGSNVVLCKDATGWSGTQWQSNSGATNGTAVYIVEINESGKSYLTDGLNIGYVAYSGTAFTIKVEGVGIIASNQSTWWKTAEATNVTDGGAVQFTPEPQGNESIIFGATLMAEAIQLLESQGYSKIQLTVTSLTGNHVVLCKDATGWSGTQWQSDSGATNGTAVYIVEINESGKSYLTDGLNIGYVAYSGTAFTVKVEGVEPFNTDQSTWWTTSETVTSEDNGQKAGLTITDGSTYFAVMHLNAEAIKYMSDLGYTSLTLRFTNDVNLEINKDATSWNNGKTNVDRPGGEFTFVIEERYLTEGVDFCFTVYTQQGTDGTAHVTFEIKGVEPFSPDQSTWWTTTETVESVDDGAKAKITITGVGYPLQMPVKLSADAVAYMKEQGYTQITLTFSDATNTVEISKDTTAWAASNTHVESGQTISYTFDITDDYVANGVQFCFSMYLNRDGVTEGTGSITVQIIGTNA